MTEQSTAEGQQEPVKEAVLEPQEGNETPGNLETENGAAEFQNLENYETSLAHDDAPICHICGRTFTWDETVQAFSHDDPCLGSADLEAALKESEENRLDALVGLVREEQRVRPYPEEENQQPAGDHHAVGDDGAAADLETAMAVGTGTIKDLQPPLGGKSFPIVGLQPDGSTKVIVSIQEGYFEAVKDWAEADGVPVERWLSDRLYEYISTYGEPAKGR